MQKYSQPNYQVHTSNQLLSKGGNRTVFDAATQVIKLRVIGKDLSNLDNEAGGHRVQRVPTTERKGRVHTSSVTVAVTDPLTRTFDERYNQRNDSDFDVCWFSGTGAGGQHRNKKQCSVRLTHVPTGIVEIRQGRQRESNLTEAKRSIINQLDLLITEESNSNMATIRKHQIGSGMRGDKIRTYRFQDDSVKDHNTGKQCCCSKVMRGYFNLLWR